VQGQGADRVLARYAVFRLAVAFHNFFTEEAEALQGFGVLYRPAEVCGFECEHLLFS
jgi:hypothetical protein